MVKCLFDDKASVGYLDDLRKASLFQQALFAFGLPLQVLLPREVVTLSLSRHQGGKNSLVRSFATTKTTRGPLSLHKGRTKST